MSTETTESTTAPTTIWDVLADGKPRSLPELVQATGLTDDAVRELLQPAIDDLRVQSIYDGRRARRTGGRGERKYRATP